MGFIKAGIQVTQTIRNVARLREIVSVFARHGFSEFISSGVLSLIPGFVLPKDEHREKLDDSGKREWAQVIGERLRLSFEELGPSFIKLGQILSSREDLFDKAFIDEMKRLRDDARPLPFSELRSFVEAQLGKKIGEVFQSVEETPLGTASIGVVYQGKLISGENVVLKVKRPGIEKIIRNDISILFFLAAQIEKISVEMRYLGISRVVRDFSISLQSEINFYTEALNCERLAKNLKKHDKNEIFHIPKLYREWTTDSLLVMERLDGIPFARHDLIESKINEVAEKLLEGIGLFLKTFLQDGFYHADLHGGNFFYLKNGQLGLVDFGLMGTLSKKGRQSFIAIIYSLLTFNFENLIFEFLEVAEYDTVPDVDSLTNDVRDALNPFVGLTVQQTNFNLVLQAIMRTLSNHKLYLPREWYTVFRTLITLDGVGKSLNLDIDLFSLLEKDIGEIAKATFSKEELIEEGVWAARDLVSLSRIFPRHLKWFLRDWVRKGHVIELRHEGVAEGLNQMAKSLTFLGLMILASVFFGAGVILGGDEIAKGIHHAPAMTLIFWGVALGLVTQAWLKFRAR